MSNLVKTEIDELTKKIDELSRDDLIQLLQKEYKDREIGPNTLGRIFEKIADPNDKGYSRTVYMDELISIHHNFKSDGGNQWARTNQNFLGKKYNIIRGHNELCPDGQKYRGVSSIKLDGFNKNRVQQAKSIRQDILKHYRNEKCVILDVVSSNGMECDHKNGMYNDYSNMSKDEQDINDFQAMSKAANDAKRQHCKVCKATHKRYDAKRLGYSESYLYGDENSQNCEGCYWYDPKLFNSVISKDYKKQ